MKKTSAFLWKISIAFSVPLFVLLAKPTFAVLESNTTELSNEFWISTSTGSANLGTLDNPFICATEPEFDYTMSNLPPNCTVHILAGTYQTLGAGGNHPAYSLKSGQKILGSGIGVTIIQLVNDAPSGTSVMGNGYPVGQGTDIEVSDLTLDCHYTPGVSGNVTYLGLSLYGSRLAARRVKVVNLVYLDESVNSEAWGIGFNAVNGGSFNSEGNIIEECEVSNFVAGTACSAIALNGGSISGIIRDNRVFLQVTNSPRVAINGANMHDTLVEGNYVNGATAGFYGDSGGYTNIIVAHNTFKNCVQAVQLSNVPRQNITFCDNTITIPTYGGVAFWFAPDTTYKNIVISGNDIRFDSQPVSGSFFLYANNIAGLIVNNNTVDSGLTSAFSGCTGVGIYNNNDQNGDFLANLNQVMPPNGITRTTVTNWYYHASYKDEYIGIKTPNAMRTVYLPSAVGCAGKQIIIDDESGTASATNPIMIYANTPSTINGSGVALTTSYGAKTIVSDGANWFAH